MTAWTDFVKQYAKENNLSYKESLKQAAPSFKQQKGPSSPTPHPWDSSVATERQRLRNEKNNAEVSPPTKKYKKVKLNIIEDEEPTPEVVPKKLKKKKLKMPSPYRKVTLNIIEDDDIETTTTNERIQSLPPLVSETEDELNKTPIPKLKEMLKELNFTKFAKFKKQDYIDKILELKNGIWWRYKYPLHYERLNDVNNYLKPDGIGSKNMYLETINKLTKDNKRNTLGVLDLLQRRKKQLDELINFDFEEDIQRLEKEAADRDANRKKKHEPISRPKIEPPPTQTRELTETIETTKESITPKKKKPRKVKLDIQESPYQNIIDEWDTAALNYVLFQQQPKIYDAIEKKLLTLAKKKSSVVIPDLLFFIKPFLDDLFVHYGSNKTALDIIQNGMADLVINMGYDEDKVFKDNTEYLGKHFNKTHKKIIYDIFANANKKPEPISRPKIDPPATKTRLLKETHETKNESNEPTHRPTTEIEGNRIIEKTIKEIKNFISKIPTMTKKEVAKEKNNLFMKTNEILQHYNYKEPLTGYQEIYFKKIRELNHDIATIYASSYTSKQNLKKYFDNYDIEKDKPKPTRVISTSSNPLTNQEFFKEKRDFIKRYEQKEKQVMNETEDDPTLRKAQLHILQYELKTEYKKLTDKYTGKQPAVRKISKPITLNDID